MYLTATLLFKRVGNFKFYLIEFCWIHLVAEVDTGTDIDGLSPGMTVIFSWIHVRLGYLGRGTCPSFSISPPWHLSADHSSHLPPLQVPNWDSLHQCQALMHSAFYLLLQAQVEIPSALSRESQGATAKCTSWKLFGSWPSTHTTGLGVFGGNTKVNILIKWLLICLNKCK